MNEETKKFITLLHKLGGEEQIRLLYMIMGARLVAQSI